MSDSYLHGYDPNNMAEEQSGPTVTPFNDNVGVCVKGEGYTFAQSGDSIIKLRQKAIEGPNKGLQFTLTFPAAPRFNRKEGVVYVPVGEEETETRRAIADGWNQALTRIVVTHKLAWPTLDDLKDADSITAWASKAEGAETVFSSYEDGNGFGAVRCMQNQQKKDYDGKEPFKYLVGIAAQDQPARNRKGEVIPGLTRLQQARAAIDKFSTK